MVAQPVDIQVPIIDLAGCHDAPSPEIVETIAQAAEEFGFFQIVNHGITDAQIAEVWKATRAFFTLPLETKREILRTKENSRGYYDRELTKNARDLKEVLDIAQVPFPELADDAPRNFHSVDGVNQWPELTDFRTTIIDYLHSCSDLAHWLLQAFCVGLGEQPDHLQDHFDADQTSFLRMNHYPLADLLSPDEATGVTALGDMALHLSLIHI